MLKAMTEFCNNGLRYRRDDEVIVSRPEAEKLLRNRLVYGTIDETLPMTDRPRKKTKATRKGVQRAAKLATEKNKATGTADDGDKTPEGGQDDPDGEKKTETDKNDPDGDPAEE